MRIIIISDTHGRANLFAGIMDSYAEVDMVVHCGDVEGQQYIIQSIAGCTTHMVAGNNDYFSDLPQDKEFCIGKNKVWLTHGHNYYVSMGKTVLEDEARARGVDIVMYGHTHRPCLETVGGLTILNPGSLTYPRQEGRRPSYILMETGDNKEPEYKIIYI